jgi:hypothetical protein
MVLRPLPTTTTTTTGRTASSSDSGQQQQQQQSNNSMYYVGRPEGAVDFLAARGHRLPNGTNVADLILDVVSKEEQKFQPGNGKVEDRINDPSSPVHKGSAGEIQITPVDIQQTQHPSPRYSTDDDNAAAAAAAAAADAAAAAGTPSSFPLGTILHLRRIKKNGCISCPKELFVLLRLECIRMYRAPFTMLVHIAVAGFMGTLVGFLYENMQPDVYGTWNRFLGLFAMVTMFALLGLSGVGTWQDGENIMRINYVC